MKKKRKKKRSFWPLLVLLVLVGVAGYFAYSANLPVDVETAAVRMGDITEAVNETGTVTARNVSTVLAKSSFEVASLSVSVGDAVSKGQLLITAVKDADQPNESGKLEAQLAGIRAQLAQRRADEMAMWEMFQNGAKSWKDFEDLETAVAALESQEASLVAAIKEAAQPAPKLSNDVTAPFSGIVTELKITEGDTAVIGRELLQITDPTDLYISVGVLENDALKVGVGSTAVLVGLGGAESFITYVSPKVRESVSELGTAQKRKLMEVTIPEGFAPALGADVEMDIITAVAENVLLAPRKAVFLIDGKNCVFVAQEGQAVLTEVALGLSNDSYYEVLSGLSAGDVVIVSPSSDVTDGRRVRSINDY